MGSGLGVGPGSALPATLTRASPTPTPTPIPNPTPIPRAGGRCALLSAPLLPLWPWAALTAEQLWACFCEVYRITGDTRLDGFAQRHPLQVQRHRRAFVDYLLSHSSAGHECYERYPTLASANDLVRFPPLSLLRRLCLLATDAAAAAAEGGYPADDAAPSRMVAVGARELLGLAVMAG